MRVAIAECISDSNPSKSYKVSRHDDGEQAWECGCIGWTRHIPRRDCKHITKVRGLIERGVTSAPGVRFLSGADKLLNETVMAAVVAPFERLATAGRIADPVSNYVRTPPAPTAPAPALALPRSTRDIPISRPAPEPAQAAAEPTEDWKIKRNFGGAGCLLEVE